MSLFWLAVPPAFAQPPGDLPGSADADIILRDCTFADNVLQCAVELQNPFSDKQVKFAMCVPAEDITTAILTDLQVARQDEFFEGGKSRQSTGTVELQTSDLGYVRNHRIVSVRFLPAVGSDGKQAVTAANLRIEFQPRVAATPDKEWAQAETTGPLRAALAKLVHNPDQLDLFAIQSRDQMPGSDLQRSDTGVTTNWAPETTGTVVGNPALRIPITANGLYRITADDLQSSGVAAGQNTPRLFLEGKEQPLQLKYPANGAGSGSPDIIFYGRENLSPFTPVQNYWLSFDSPGLPPPLKFRETGATTSSAAENATFFTDTAVIEEDHQVLTKSDQFLTILDYRWVWTELTTGSQLKSAFDLPGMARIEQNIPGTVYLYTHSWSPNSRPRVKLRVNGTDVQEFLVNAATDEKFNFQVPVGLLKPSGNSAIVELFDEPTTAAVAGDRRPARLELFLDRIEFRYPRLYEVRETGLEFRSPSRDLLSDLPSTETRNVSYRILCSGSADDWIIADITTETAVLVNAQFGNVQAPGSNRIASFTAQETGMHRYIMARIKDLPRPGLVPVTERPDLHAQQDADYIIIAHGDFIPGIQRYAQRKRDAGHAVQVVDIRDIYDQFDAGQERPQAIKAFLRHAALNWRGAKSAPAASYVLLVGDATSAYRNQFRNSVINYVPSFSVQSSPGAADSFASDSWFACFSGDDLLADTMLGRLSINNADDLEVVLQKHEEYLYGSSETTSTETGAWTNHLAFVSDHSDFEKPVSRIMSETVPSRFFQSGIFMSDEPWVDNYYFPREIADAKKAKVSPATTQKIRDMFNNGAALVTYFGHGSPNVWSNERIWFGGDSENSDNHMLTNRRRLAFIINMTCNSGAIDYPMPKWNICISEDFMRAPNGGAVGCYVPSGPGVTSQHERFTREINLALLRDKVDPLPAALALANWRYLLAGNPNDLVRMFILLGDPELQLRLPSGDESLKVSRSDAELEAVLPQEYRATSGAYQVRSTGVFDNAVLPFTTGTTVLRSPTPDATAFAVYADTNPPAASGATMPQPPFLRIESAVIEPAGLMFTDDPITATIRAMNPNNRTIDGVDLAVQDQTGKDVAAFSLPAMDAGRRQIFHETFSAPNGLSVYSIVEKHADGKVVPLYSNPEFCSTAIARDTSGTELRAEIESSTLQVKYERTGAGTVARIVSRVFNLSPTPLKGVEAALVNANQEPLSEAIITLPETAPGKSARLDLSQEITTGSAPLDAQLMLDPHGKLENFRRGALPQIRIAVSEMADIAIPVGGVTVSPPDPSDGETVFFDVLVENRGKSPCESVRIDAATTTRGAPEPLESRVIAAAGTVSLDPGATATIRVRWDPFRNAGNQVLSFKAAASPDVAESNYENNVQIVPLYVRTKYNLRPTTINAEVSPEDARRKQIRFIARVENSGESPARGVKVVFYGTRDRKMVLGETSIEEIAPKSHADSVLIYKLKPGEESFPFQPAFEAKLKGSVQRVFSN